MTRWQNISKHLLALVDGHHSLLYLVGPVRNGFSFSWWCDGKHVAFYLPLDSLYLDVDDLITEHLNGIVAMRVLAGPCDYDAFSGGKDAGLLWVEDRYESAQTLH